MTPPDFAELVADTHERLRSYIAGMGIPLSEVDDIAQDVYLEFLRQGCSAPAGVALPSWLHGIARNLARNHLRRKGSRARHLQALADLLATVDGPVDEERRLGALRDCLGSLEERQRRLLDLHYVQEQTSDRIAGIMGRSATAVRMALMRVRDALRGCIERAIGQDGAP